MKKRITQIATLALVVTMANTQVLIAQNENATLMPFDANHNGIPDVYEWIDEDENGIGDIFECEDANNNGISDCVDYLLEELADDNGGDNGGGGTDDPAGDDNGGDNGGGGTDDPAGDDNGGDNGGGGTDDPAGDDNGGDNGGGGTDDPAGDDNGGNGMMVSVNSSASKFFTTYPNPAHEFVHVQFDSGSAVAKIELRNLAGQILFSEIKNTNINGDVFRIELANFIQGYYFLTVTQGDNSYCQRLVVY